MVDFEGQRARVETALGRIAEAARRSGRSPKDVRLIGVTKTHSVDQILPAAQTGLLLAFGENRVQEAEGKIELWPDDVPMAWHLIGHLQRNKAKKAVALFDMIHTLDSLRLAETVDRLLLEAKKTAYPVLIEVNTSGEVSKHGVSEDDAISLTEAVISRCLSLDVRGFMTVGPLSDDKLAVARAFAALRKIRDRAVVAMGRPFPELSMGMSGDYELAVEEGSTIVRLGSALFGERERRHEKIC